MVVVMLICLVPMEFQFINQADVMGILVGTHMGGPGGTFGGGGGGAQ